VENLLQLTHGDRSKSNVFEDVNLSTLLADVSDSMRPLAEAKELALHCEVSTNLILLGDSDELIRLFVNLLDNATKYTDRGKIRVSARRVENKIEI